MFLTRRREHGRLTRAMRGNPCGKSRSHRNWGWPRGQPQVSAGKTCVAANPNSRRCPAPGRVRVHVPEVLRNATYGAHSSADRRRRPAAARQVETAPGWRAPPRGEVKDVMWRCRQPTNRNPGHAARWTTSRCSLICSVDLDRVLCQVRRVRRAGKMGFHPGVARAASCRCLDAYDDAPFGRRPRVWAAGRLWRRYVFGQGRSTGEALSRAASRGGLPQAMIRLDQNRAL